MKTSTLANAALVIAVLSSLVGCSDDEFSIASAPTAAALIPSPEARPGAVEPARPAPERLPAGVAPAPVAEPPRGAIDAPSRERPSTIDVHRDAHVDDANEALRAARAAHDAREGDGAGGRGGGPLGDGEEAATAGAAGAPVVAADEPHIVQIAAGGEHSCAVTSDGAVRCWGNNEQGQLGLGHGTSPRVATPTEVPSLSGIVEIALGDAHSCALSASGQVRCWGVDVRGQVGDGAPPGAAPRPWPVLITGLEGRFVHVAAGAHHSCAVRDDGDVLCWGQNDHGQLGDGSTDDRAAPVIASMFARSVAVAAGGSHSCSLDRNGSVHCWGDGADGQLGLGAAGFDVVRPLRVLNLSGATQLVAGSRHSCVLGPSAKPFCWGLGEAFGSDEPGAVAQPSLAMAWAGGDVVLDSGGAFSCVSSNGVPVCVGENDRGQLGRGALGEGSGEPASVSGLSTVKALAAGRAHACAVVGAGGVGDLRCWGAGDQGQLGDGPMVDRSSPVVPLW